MNFKMRIIAILIITILILSISIIFSFNQSGISEAKDILPPAIDSVTGSITQKAGETTIITIKSSDNVGVILAKLYYRPASALRWSSTSILSGNASISIPADTTENWYYYVLIDDAAGNGPIGKPSIDGSLYYTITIIPNSKTNIPDGRNNSLFQHDSTIPHVFFEVGTKIVCSECPKIADILDEMFKSGNYPFYYVSLSSTDSIATQHINQYNLYGYPTIYVDGGYRVLMGSSIQKSDLEQAITAALARQKPNIYIDLQATPNYETNELTANVVIKNNKNTSYNGHLRVYLTDLVSTSGEGNTPQRFLFRELLIDDDIEIKPMEQIKLVKNKSIELLDPENIVLFSAVFNSEKITSYSYPPNKNPFNAYYVDAVSAALVVEGGNIPPEVGILNPKVNYYHILGNPVRKSMFGKTILLGRTTIIANVSDDSAVVKAEFYVNGKLMKTIDTPPYQWVWHQLAFGKETITIKVYDDQGKTSSASITAFVIMKWKNPFVFILNQIR